MSHFAQLDDDNKVIFVTVGRQEDDGKEQELCDRTGDTYRQTSYNTYGGVHYTDGEPSEDQTKAFRYNFAGVGFSFDPSLGDYGAFIPPQPFPSWQLDPSSALWEAPIPMPEDGASYYWDEDQGDWIELVEIDE